MAKEEETKEKKKEEKGSTEDNWAAKKDKAYRDRVKK